MAEAAPGRKTILKLSAVFALVYFFSPNGLASLPGLTVSFLLKDTLGMTATQAAYFGAVTILGWVVKPLWGIISDALPIFGSRRKSYLLATALLAAAIWFALGQIENYTVRTLLLLFTLSSVMYAFMDVVTDGLMVETGKPLGLTGRFQSVQWTAVYLASVITGFAGGWAAEHWRPQTTFLINAAFPLVILAAIIFFIREERVLETKAQFRQSLASLKQAFSHATLWLLAFFLFFWTFSPSFGTPFFYYSVDMLKFDKIFLGAVSSVSAATAALGAILYGVYSKRFRTRTFVHIAIAIGVVATLFDLTYFLPYIREHLALARWIYLSSAAVLGIVGAATFLVMLNAAALAAPKFAEGTTFATLTSFWNIGLMGSGALGGWLFAKIGLPPLIIVSAVFTAATWLLMPYLKFADDVRSA